MITAIHRSKLYNWWINNTALGNWWCWKRPIMSRCRVCGSAENVISYDPRGAWAYFWRNTYCPDHCPDHDYHRYSDGTYCDNCGIDPPYDWYDR